VSRKINNILFNLLIDKKLVQKTVLEELISQIPSANGSVWISELSTSGLIQEGQVLKLLADSLGMVYRSIKNDPIDEGVLKKIPIKVASYYQFIPLYLENNKLTIGVYYPMDIKKLDEIRFQLGYGILQVIANKDEVLGLLRENYGLGAQTIEKMFLDGTAEKVAFRDREAVEDIEKDQEDATIANLVNQIILDAYKKRATDIHIEPFRSGVKFRYRIDGVLYDAHVSSHVKQVILAILSRIKIMSNLDIVEKRLPQDGQAVVKIGDQQLDLRVSFIPASHGESVVIRILPSVVLFDMDKLGLSARDKSILGELIKRPNGIIFVTGPTGSGKTTTLYACLNKLNTRDKKIITIEDPVEYEISGVTQIQVNPLIGLSFAAGLKSVLRHDPDIMMVGEVRDLETAEIAIRVALTGHLVFSTLHTNSAAASVHRLFDIGIEPYLVHSSAIAFMAQRLIRVLCPECKRVMDNPNEQIVNFIRSALGLSVSKSITLFKHVGCDKCNNTGYYGRTALYEILPVDDPIKELIQAKASAREIERSAISRGMETMLQSGLKKVVNGITTVEELMNILTIQPVTLTRSNPVQPDETGLSSIDKKVRACPHDKRVYVRLPLRFLVTFVIHDGASPNTKERLLSAGVSESRYSEEHKAMTDNISAGGTLFRYDIPLIMGTVLALTLSIPFNSKEDPRVVHCFGKVTRIEPSQEKGLYNIAVCFLDMSSADRSILNDFIEGELTRDVQK